MPKLAVENPVSGKEIKLTNVMGLAKLFGGIVLLVSLYKLATGTSDKLLGRTSKFTHYGEVADTDPYAGMNVI